jgi:hypothetical protein
MVPVIAVGALCAMLTVPAVQAQPAGDQAKIALAHLYQARDELNAAGTGNPHRDRALHDIYAAIDETRSLANGPMHETNGPDSMRRHEGGRSSY